jgi:hypothetical protein
LPGNNLRQLTRTSNHSKLWHNRLRLDEAVFLKQLEDLQGYPQGAEFLVH